MRYISFIVRLWLPRAELKPDLTKCHGSVEHIQSGEAARVGSLEDIQHFMKRWLTGASMFKEGREKDESIQ